MSFEEVMQAMDGQVEVRSCGDGSLALTLLVERAQPSGDGREYITVHFTPEQREEFVASFLQGAWALATPGGGS